MYLVWIVNFGKEVKKNLTEDRLRPVVGTDGWDDHIHVDAKAGEIHHGLHSTDGSNCSPSFGLVRMGKNPLHSQNCFNLTLELSFNKNFIPLWKKSGRFH
jgi:hypothetical protein